MVVRVDGGEVILNRFRVRAAAQRGIDNHCARELVNRRGYLFRLGRPLAQLGPAQVVGDDGAIGELL